MPYTIRKVKNGYKVCKRDEPTTCFSNEGIPKENAEKQLKAIGMSGGLKPLTARVGGKVLLKKKIVEVYFPKSDSYTTYVEPFVGGGSVYFYANKDDHKEVINDIDPDLYTIFKGFKDYPAKKIAEDVNGDYTENDFEDIKKSQPTSAYNKFLKTFLLYRLSYFGRGLSFGKPRINSNFEGYQDRLKDTDIYNKDYKEIIKKYNKPSTFFYLDPPARESSGNYRFSAIDIPELVKILKTIKGKFLLSIANIDVKKDVFKPFKIITVPTKYVGKKQQGGQTEKVKEYLIMNYEPRMSGGLVPVAQLPSKIGFGAGTHKENVLKRYKMEDKGHSLEELSKISSVPLKTLQEVYNRGVGAYKTNPKSVRLKGSYVKNVDAPMSKKLSKEQWGMARVYSFLDGNPKHDNDLRGGMKISEDSVTIPKDEFCGEHKRLVKFFTEEAKDQGEEYNKVCKGCKGKCGGAVSEFQDKLDKMGLDPMIYFKKAKELAKHTGYDPSKLLWCDTGKNKLMYESPDGLVHFGNPNYYDYIIYSWLESQGEVEPGTADERRRLYRARATKIKGDWEKNKYSPNNMAINVLW